MTEVPKVYAAIAQVMADMAGAGIQKSRTNAQQNYKFRGIDDVYNALSRSLANAQLCVLPRVVARDVTERATKNGGVLFYVTCTVDFDFVSAVDGSRHTVSVVGEAMDSADKATNKAMSAAYKYACIQAFCIPTEGDNDAESASHDVAPSVDFDAWLDAIDSADAAALSDIAKDLAETTMPISTRQKLRAAYAARRSVVGTAA